MAPLRVATASKNKHTQLTRRDRTTRGRSTAYPTWCWSSSLASCILFWRVALVAWWDTRHMRHGPAHSAPTLSKRIGLERTRELAGFRWSVPGQTQRGKRQQTTRDVRCGMCACIRATIGHRRRSWGTARHLILHLVVPVSEGVRVRKETSQVWARENKPIQNSCASKYLCRSGRPRSASQCVRVRGDQLARAAPLGLADGDRVSLSLSLRVWWIGCVMWFELDSSGHTHRGTLGGTHHTRTVVAGCRCGLGGTPWCGCGCGCAAVGEREVECARAAGQTEWAGRATIIIQTERCVMCARATPRPYPITPHRRPMRTPGDGQCPRGGCPSLLVRPSTAAAAAAAAAEVADWMFLVGTTSTHKQAHIPSHACTGRMPPALGQTKHRRS